MGTYAGLSWLCPGTYFLYGNNPSLSRVFQGWDYFKEDHVFISGSTRNIEMNYFFSNQNGHLCGSIRALYQGTYFLYGNNPSLFRFFQGLETNRLFKRRPRLFIWIYPEHWNKLFFFKSIWAPMGVYPGFVRVLIFYTETIRVFPVFFRGKRQIIYFNEAHVFLSGSIQDLAGRIITRKETKSYKLCLSGSISAG